MCNKHKFQFYTIFRVAKTESQHLPHQFVSHQKSIPLHLSLLFYCQLSFQHVDNLNISIKYIILTTNYNYGSKRK